MNIEKVQEAAQKLLGEHNFQNFCKKDDSIVEKERENYMRRIMRFDIEEKFKVQGDNVYVAIIRGTAFLWHQVRCMMSVLFMIGRGEEEMSVIDDLFNVELLKERPNYEYASEKGLILDECGFNNVEWRSGLMGDYETYV